MKASGMGTSSRWAISSYIGRAGRGSEGRRRYGHQPVGAGGDAGETQSRFRQGPLDIGAADRKILRELRIARGDLRAGGLGDLAPHMAERDQAEEMQIIGRAGAGI